VNGDHPGKRDGPHHVLLARGPGKEKKGAVRNSGKSMPGGFRGKETRDLERMTSEAVSFADRWTKI
jgi:hypothetical protein